MKHYWILSALCLLAACKTPPHYDAQVGQKAALQSTQYHSFSHRVSGESIHGVHTGKACAPGVLFIHGAPGGWEGWGEYLGDKALNESAFLMAMDRPGYGESHQGKWQPSLKKQSRAIIESALQEHAGPFIVVGHSFGGPIALQLAIDYPKQVSQLIILAGSVDPDLEETKWMQYIADSPLFQWLVPSALDVANQEILPLRGELKNQHPYLASIHAPALVIQGEDDELVPPANADYIQTQLHNSKLSIIRLKNQGHFLPWQQYELVKSEILQRLPANKCALQSTHTARFSALVMFLYKLG
jgi:pimeloyl-ACP methyl ester carboxylesterase